MNVDELIKAYYTGYELKKWETIERLLAERFTFTSPNDDDHLDIQTYKTRCWPQAEFIKRFEFESVLRGDGEAFVKYLCTTTEGTNFRNTEYFRFSSGKIAAVEVYFGGRLGYPTASVAGQS